MWQGSGRLAAHQGAVLPEIKLCSVVTLACFACSACVSAAAFGNHSTGNDSSTATLYANAIA
jgi:hypothetical protein